MFPTPAPRWHPTRRWYRWMALAVALLTAGTLALPSIVLAGATDRPGHGVLQVSTQPALPAPIVVNGSVRNTGGVHSLELPVGDHEVTFGAVSGYVSPPVQTVSVSEGETVSVVGEFQPAGTLEVTVEAASLGSIVTVDGVERDRAPVILKLGEGTYEVCFETLAADESVDCIEAHVMAGQETVLNHSYLPTTDNDDDEGAVDDPALARVDEGLVALYDFAERSGAYVSDVAGLNDGMDLTVEDPSAVTWTRDGLRLDRATLAATSGAPKALYDSVAATGEFTVEAWITPANTSQDGPARIATLSRDTRSQNFLLGQDGDSVQVRSRERQGNWRWNTASGSVTTELTHVLMSHASDGTVSVYLNGELAGREKMSSGPDSWDESYSFAIGMEFNDLREWLGTYHLVALYDTALDANDVERNYTIGPDVDGGADASESSDDAKEATGEDDEPMDSNEGAEGTEPARGDAGTADALSQHGVTWTFSQEHQYGSYANGDYWVLGPVDIVNIDPASTSSDGRTMNGSMINPSPRDGGELGYGHIRDNEYAPEKNVSYDVSEQNPLQVAPHSSLVSTISVEEANARPGIETAAVLTVVDSVPAEGSFRPPYSGKDKTARFTTDQLRYDLLPNLNHVEGAPDIQQMASRFERVWLDHRGGWQGRSIHPVSSMPDYGRNLASRLGQGSLALMLDYPDEQKEQLLVNYVQIGIDLYGIVDDGGERNWTPGGGHAQGRKWPILFAGTMLDDEVMASIGDRDEVYFGEDAQTFYVTQQHVDRGHGYSSSDIGMPEWGIVHALDPSRDDASWSASYRQCCTANSWTGHVLSARIMGLQDAWNHDPLFDYTDRFVSRQADEGKAGDWRQFWDRPFTENMWDTYRPRS